MKPCGDCRLAEITLAVIGTVCILATIAIAVGLLTGVLS